MSGGPGPAGTLVPVRLRQGGPAGKPAASGPDRSSPSAHLPPGPRAESDLAAFTPPSKAENPQVLGRERGLHVVSFRVEWAADCAGPDGGALALNGFVGKESGDLGHPAAPGFHGAPRV